jgi:hypothetical protein
MARFEVWLMADAATSAAPGQLRARLGGKTTPFVFCFPARTTSDGVQTPAYVLVRSIVHGRDEQAVVSRAMSQAVDGGLSTTLLKPPVIRRARRFRRSDIERPLSFGGDGPGDAGGDGPAGVREPRRPKPGPPSLQVALPEPGPEATPEG